MKKDKGTLKKPPKQMFGMVAKWQKAKQEMVEEEERLIKEREIELNEESDMMHRIEKWKSEQLQRYHKWFTNDRICAYVNKGVSC